MSPTPGIDCTGTWRPTQTIHGNIEVLHCSGCGERMVIYRGRRLPVPDPVIGAKAIVQWIRRYPNRQA